MGKRHADVTIGCFQSSSLPLWLSTLSISSHLFGRCLVFLWLSNLYRQSPGSVHLRHLWHSSSCSSQCYRQPHQGPNSFHGCHSLLPHSVFSPWPSTKSTNDL